MIIGGIGGVCRTGADGSKTGCRETFIQCMVSGTGDISEARHVKFSSRLRIRNVGDTAWVEIPDVEYWNFYSTGGCNATVRDAEKWSSLGVLYPGLLSASRRLVQIIVDTTVAGVTSSQVVYTGYVANYSEAHGQSNSAITLVLKPIANLLTTGSWIYVYPAQETLYITMLKAMFEIGLPGPLIFMLPDGEQDQLLSYNSLLLLTWKLASSRYVLLQSVGSALVAEYQVTADSSPLSPHSFSDANSNVSLTRTVTPDAYNAMWIVFYTAGTPHYTADREYVEIAADVAARGAVVGPVWAGSNSQWTKAGMIDHAEKLLAQGVLGKVTIQTRMNPYLAAQQRCSFSSDRMQLSGTATILEFHSRYRCGEAVSYVTVAVKP